VHEDVAAKDKGMRVYLRYDAAAGGTDVGEHTVGFGVVAERLEVEVVDGWGLGFVEGRPGAIDVLDVRGGSFCVPWVV